MNGKSGTLASGDRVGPYVVERALYSGGDESSFLARTVSDEGTSYVTLIARPRGGFTEMERIAALNLRHPRLLAPRAVLTHGDRDVLVLDALAAPDGTASVTAGQDRKSTRLNSSHPSISYAVFCLKKKKTNITQTRTQ